MAFSESLASRIQVGLLDYSVSQRTCKNTRTTRVTRLSFVADCAA